MAAASKKIFKAEINRISKLSALFSFSLKLNGKQVILSEDNQKKIKEVTHLLDTAVHKLSEIK